MYRNIIGLHPGTKQPEKKVIVIAHYDTVAISSGADDNASGIAAVLELARVLRPFQDSKPSKLDAIYSESGRFNSLGRPKGI